MELNQQYLLEYSKKQKELERDPVRGNQSEVLEKYEFQKQAESKSQTFLAFLDYQNFKAGSQVIIFLKNTSQKTNISIATLVEENKSVAMEKYESDYRGLPKLVALSHSRNVRETLIWPMKWVCNKSSSGVSWLSRFWFRNAIYTFFKTNSPQNEKVL